MKANAVFAGGGIKGIGLLGAFSVAEEQGYRWEKLAGTSVGGMLAALVASGYKAREIYEIIEGFDFTQLYDGDFQKLLPGLGMLTSIIFERDLPGQSTGNWMRSLLKAKGVSTFGDLPPGRLSLIAADLTKNRMVILPDDLPAYGLTPEKFSVAQAVRMSASLPFFFAPALLKNGKTASYIVDGALISNFPIWLFQKENLPTFGFHFQTDHQPQKANNLLEYIQAIILTTISGLDKRSITQGKNTRLIAVPTLGISTADFALTPGQKKRLYEAGRAAAQEFFRR